VARVRREEKEETLTIPTFAQKKKRAMIGGEKECYGVKGTDYP